MADHNQRPNAMAFLQHRAWRFFRVIPHMMLIPSLGFGLHSLVALALAALASFVLSARRDSSFHPLDCRAFVLSEFWHNEFEDLYCHAGGRSIPGADLPSRSSFFRGHCSPPSSIRKIAHAGMIISGVALLFVSGVLCGHATRATGWRTADVVRLREIARTIKSESGSIVRFEGPSNWAWRGTVDVLEPTLTAVDVTAQLCGPAGQ